MSALSIDWDDELAECTEQLLMKRALPSFEDPFWPYPDINGEFTLGSTGIEKVGVDRDTLTQGMLVTGRSGAGKTNLFIVLMGQMIENNVPFIAFDFKQDFRHLIREYENVVAIPHKRFRFNPLKPPEGVGPDRWMGTFADVYCHSNALLQGSKNYLLKHINDLYRRWGVFDGNKEYPTMHDLAFSFNQGRKISSKNAWYHDTVKNRIQASIISEGSIFDCETGFSIPDLLNKNVILEMDGMMEDVQNFMVEMLLAWIYNYRLANGHRGKLRHVVFFDEAKRVFDVNKERQPASGIPTINILTERTREFGEAFVVADQEPSKLTHAIQANTGTKVALSMTNGIDIDIIARSMGLEKDQVKECHNLEIGYGIVKVGSSRPVPIKVKEVSIRKDVTDEEVNQNFKRHALTFRPRMKHGNMDKENGRLSGDAERLLIDVNQNPITPVTDRYRQLGMSIGTGNRAKLELLKSGHVRAVSIHLKQRGGNPIILDLTLKGRKYLEEKGHTVSANEKGGAEHRFWQHKIREVLRSFGCKVSVEVFIGKRSVDLVSVCPNRKAVAIEIAMNPFYEITNIRKDLGLGFDDILIACRDNAVMESVKRTVKGLICSDDRQKIRFIRVSDFLDSERVEPIREFVSMRRNKEELEPEGNAGGRIM